MVIIREIGFTCHSKHKASCFWAYTFFAFPYVYGLFSVYTSSVPRFVNLKYHPRGCTRGRYQTVVDLPGECFPVWFVWIQHLRCLSGVKPPEARYDLIHAVRKSCTSDLKSRDLKRPTLVWARSKYPSYPYHFLPWTLIKCFVNRYNKYCLSLSYNHKKSATILIENKTLGKHQALLLFFLSSAY